MKAVLRLVYLYFTCTPAHRICSAIGVTGIVWSYVMLVSMLHGTHGLPQITFAQGALGMAGVASIFIGSSMMPLVFGRMARSHMSSSLPGARLKLLASALITLIIVSSSVPILSVIPQLAEFNNFLAHAPAAAHLTADRIATMHEGMIQTFLLTYSLTMLFSFWLYVALWFITSKRNTMGYLQGLTVLAAVLLTPTRQILQPEDLVRWDLTVCLSTLFAFSTLFLAWPRLRVAAGRLRLGAIIANLRRRTTRTRGREIDLLLGTANPWLLGVGQLVPVMLAARIGFYSPAVWLYYLTLFSTVAGAIAGQAAERSRALWLRGDWSTVQLFSQVERSFWRHNNYVLAILLTLMVAIGSYAKLPVTLLATGLPLLILGTTLSTYLGLMLTRGLHLTESLLAVGIMLALMAVAVLAARRSDELMSVIILESALALVALVLAQPRTGSLGAYRLDRSVGRTGHCRAGPQREAGRSYRGAISGNSLKTASMGIAKPMPCAPRITRELMPMTRPSSVISGPPLLPGLMGASVCT